MRITWLGILSIVLIVLWAVLFLLKKGQSGQRGVFIGAHCALYLSFMLLREPYFFLIAICILVITSVICLIDVIRRKRDSATAWKRNLIYYIFTVFLAVFVPLAYLVLKSAVSFLSLY
jgi:hypothetical protein